MFEKPQPQGEEAARQWTAHLPAVAAYVRAMVGDFHDAQDVLQDVSVAVVRKYREYDKSRPFIAWVIGIARFEVLAYRRQASMDSRIFDDEAVEQITQAFIETKGQMHPLAEALEHCLKGVSGRARRLIELRYVRDMKCEQMAEALHATTTSVKVAMHRIRMALRDCVERRMTRGETA